ncbi:hypothetical protein [Xanthocytophaga flava]|uniref:hypothetical protein n=1 Tax=Xanthocytophaga flava TaxID=3048013 RepID=UPI0028D636D7|nr:hypothetical protein [Xanthocytophaga flavus]MDJ1470213.1 hypothetical protein [Xanthocytophaga flavus]
MQQRDSKVRNKSQHQRSGKLQRVPSVNRLNFPNRKHGKSSFGGRERPEVPSLIHNTGFTPVNVSVLPKSKLEVLLKQSLTNPAKLISDLYTYLSGYTTFMDRQDWLPSTSPAEVLTWLLNQLSILLPKNESIGIPRYEDRHDNYDLVRRIHYYQHETIFCGLPLWFLPSLKSYPLHDILIGFVHHLNKVKGIQLWDEDEDYALGYLESQVDEQDYGEDFPKDYIQELKEEIALYREGDAHVYREIIQKSSLSLSVVTTQVEKFKPVSDFEKGLIDWIKLGLELFDSSYSLLNFSHCITDGEAEEYPILPHQYLRFVWVDEGHTMNAVFDSMNENYAEYGAIPLVWSKPIKNLADLTQSPPDFPNHLYDFFEKGNSLFSEISKYISTFKIDHDKP